MNTDPEVLALTILKGVNKTHKNLQKNYCWSNMKKIVQRIIDKFDLCQRHKLVRKRSKKPMVLTDTPGQSFDKVAMDVVGPICPVTES